MKRAAALLCAFSLAAFLAAPAQARTERFDKVIDKAFDASGLNRVRIHAENLRVQGWDEDSVVVHAEYHVKSKGWLLFGSQSYDLEFRTSDNTLIIQEIEEGGPSFGIWMTRTARNRVEVKVPRNLAVEIHSDDGSIRLYDLCGPVRVDFEDGRLRAENIMGPDFRVHFEDGAVTLSQVRGSLTMHFEDGRLELRDSDLSALQLKFSDGRAELETGVRGEGPYRVRFDDGRLEWTFPEVPATDIDARVSDGSIRVDFPGLDKTFSRRHFVYSSGYGGPPVEIRGKDGRIRLESFYGKQKRFD
jgi:hypothetical protein